MNRRLTRHLSLWATLLLAGSWPDAARAATITVTAQGDDNVQNGICSLREAIVEANANSQAATVDCVFDTSTPFGNDTIQLIATGYGLSISGVGEDAAATGDLDITDSLTIQGPAVGFLTISANGLDRVFQVVPDSVTVHLNSLIITGGNADDPADLDPALDVGGCINNNGILILDDTVVRNCSATGNGGGIFNSADGSLTIQNGSSIGVNGSASVAQNGGGVANMGELTLDDSHVDFNYAVTVGAGIWNSGSLHVQNQSTVDHNGIQPPVISRGGPVLTNTGGGIHQSGTATIEDSSVSSNQTSQRGGGIYNTTSTTLSILRSQINDNQSNKGGGMLNNAGTVTIGHSVFARNVASQQGGGIINTGTTMTIFSSTIQQNDGGTTGGGGIFNRVPLTLVNVTLSGNSATGDGGGLSNTGSVAVANLANVTISNNLTDVATSPSDQIPTGGGGILNSAFSTVSYKNTIIEGNHPQDCALDPNDGVATSLGHNISGDATCHLGAARGSMDQPNTDPELLPLAANGGFGMTHAMAGRSSPAVDRGDASGCKDFAAQVLLLDQREDDETPPNQFIRPIDGDFTGGAQCDVGAFELQVHDLQSSGCTNEPFFSEYVHGFNACSMRGSSNFHAVEIFNGTSSAILLTGQYSVQIFQDGSSTATSVIPLIGTVAAGDTFVLTDPGTVGATQFFDQSSVLFNFDGNDAIALAHGIVLVDVIGIIGQNPGTQWGTGLATTKNATIRRLPSVGSGRPSGFANPANITDEWAGICTSVGYLGAHENDACVPPTSTPTATATPTATPLPLGVQPGKSSGLLTLLVIALAGLVLGRAQRGRPRAES